MTDLTDPYTSAPHRVSPPRIYPGILGLVAIPLIAGGAWLAGLGGSTYYLLAGLTVAMAAALLWKGFREGAWLYAALLVATTAWAIWESGFDGWALLPRLAGPYVLGAWLLTPSIRRRTTPRKQTTLGGGRRRYSPLAFLLATTCAVALGSLLHLARPIAVDPAYQVTAPTPAESNPLVGEPLQPAGEDWSSFGGDQGGRRYSSLDKITPGNVGDLQVAWTAHVGFAQKGAKASLELTPLKVGDTVYVCTGYNDVLALDAETGALRWRFNAGIPQKGYGRCRGIVHYQVPGRIADCPERIITNTMDARLIALDARTGKPCAGFGRHGQTSLLTGMGHVPAGYYYVTSAPTLVRGKVVLGGWVSDGQYWGEPSGVIRAFDAVTGRFAWAFDMGRPNDHGEPAAGRNYTRSTPNSWAPMSADEELGLVYAPTGNATPDYYGVQRRPFDDRYSSAVVAIDAGTGAVRWSFQTTHHDLWDYDVASQPVLVDVPAGRGMRRALLQATKRGEIFMLDRVTGRPIAAVQERPVPTDGVPGERVSPTQPFSVGLPSFRGPDLTESMMWGVTPIDQMLCRIRFRQARYEGPLTPPNTRPTVKYPGTLGGIDWGGIVVDPVRQIMFVASDRVANYDTLIARDETRAMGIHPNSKLTDSVGPRYTQGGTPYGALIHPFLSPLGAPCQQPPYGMLSAVDLRSHRLLWSHPLGTARDSGPLGLRSRLPITMGTPIAGSALVTKSGLLFIGGTQERAFRALDVRTGRELWKARLPAGGQSGPITYIAPRSQRQMVLIPAGGNTAIQSGLGDSIIAYALPSVERPVR